MRRSYRRSAMITLALALAVLVVGRLGWLKPVTTGLDYVTTPIRASFRALGSGIAGLGSNISEIRHLQAENARLRDQVQGLRQLTSEDTEIRHQNDILRSQLKIGGAVSQHLVPADVIGYQPDNFRQFLTIARGSNDGLSLGMAVVANGQLVGQISSVNRTTAKVFLITDPNFKVDAIDQTSRADGTVQGQLGSGLEMNKIAQDAAVNPGDTIITSGLGGALPKGLIIGQIQSVNQRANQVFQTAQLNTDLRINKLELIFVVTSP